MDISELNPVPATMKFHLYFSLFVFLLVIGCVLIKNTKISGAIGNTLYVSILLYACFMFFIPMLVIIGSIFVKSAPTFEMIAFYCKVFLAAAVIYAIDMAIGFFLLVVLLPLVGIYASFASIKSVFDR